MRARRTRSRSAAPFDARAVSEAEERDAHHHARATDARTRLLAMDAACLIVDESTRTETTQIAGNSDSPLERNRSRAFPSRHAIPLEPRGTDEMHTSPNACGASARAPGSRKGYGSSGRLMGIRSLWRDQQRSGCIEAAHAARSSAHAVRGWLARHRGFGPVRNDRWPRCTLDSVRCTRANRSSVVTVRRPYSRTLRTSHDDARCAWAA